MDFTSELHVLEKKGLRRRLRHLESAQDSKIIINGKQLTTFAANNYLGLCNDPRLKEAAKDAIDRFGTGSGASRLLAGGSQIHADLEREIADWLGTESALIFNTGYMANLGIISALLGKDSVVFCDRLNHASIIDGIRLSGCKLVVYKHCDVQDLEEKANRYGKSNGLIITDGIFSMDGDIAPLPDLLKVAETHDWPLLVDDAHAIGILGNGGRGTAEHFGIDSEKLIRMGTLSKSLGSEGGFVAGSLALKDFLINKARSLIYSTALPASVAASALTAIKFLINDEEIPDQLRKKSIFFRELLQREGFETNDFPTPIIPIVIGDTNKTLAYSEELMEQGYFVPAIRPPTVPDGSSRLRISLCLNHSEEEMKGLVSALSSARKTLG